MKDKPNEGICLEYIIYQKYRPMLCFWVLEVAYKYNISPYEALSLIVSNEEILEFIAKVHSITIGFRR